MENNVIIYKEFLLEENKKTNLVSRKTIDEDLDLHIEDSLKIFEYLEIKKKKMIDIGSGAGFPGLVMAIGNGENEYTLLESELKKCNFMRKVIELLKMNYVRVIRGRAEEMARNPKHREKYDVCTSRAVSSIRVVLEYCMPFTREGGIVLLWKGPRYEEEIQSAKKAMELLGGEVEKVYLYTLGDRQRAIVQIRKRKRISDKYPRRAGMPVKRPL